MSYKIINKKTLAIQSGKKFIIYHMNIDYSFSCLSKDKSKNTNFRDSRNRSFGLFSQFAER